MTIAPITYWNRHAGRLEQELVYGEGALRGCIGRGPVVRSRGAAVARLGERALRRGAGHCMERGKGRAVRGEVRHPDARVRGQAPSPASTTSSSVGSSPARGRSRQTARVAASRRLATSRWIASIPRCGSGERHRAVGNGAAGRRNARRRRSSAGRHSSPALSRGLSPLPLPGRRPHHASRGSCRPAAFGESARTAVQADILVTKNARSPSWTPTASAASPTWKWVRPWWGRSRRRIRRRRRSSAATRRILPLRRVHGGGAGRGRRMDAGPRPAGAVTRGRETLVRLGERIATRG